MRRQVVLVLAVVLAAMLVGGCTTTGSRDIDADVAAIRQIWVNYVSFVEKGDAAAWLALWDDAGIQMPPGDPAWAKAQFSAAIPGAFKARMDANTTKMVIDSQEVTVADGWAYSRGVYTMELKNKSTGAVMRIDGKFLTILRRQADGGWKIYRDCFNSNVP